ncbi:oxidoreductase [Flavobacterium selenitireducens]|uniref:oxidoreductase n=1 Tax=Flavobacterium selenitireducens TaxID=2722704 RepID=UPI00168B4C62|nr:oxidoreductase [Flavobacterium selenitireducens]MBD3581920.1 SDR family NAD(P)-dependent oxidoreductase [Flavobacterium selenitireducens]
MWTINNMPDQSGKLAIVTGANTGIGKETAKALYDKGATVILACRDSKKAQAALEEIVSDGSKGRLEIGMLDLSDLESVRNFAQAFKARHDKLDILINNAGIMLTPEAKTKQGFELQFGVNFLSHFALTALLFPTLKAAANARVVTLTSGAATLTNGIDFGNLRIETGYDSQKAYNDSKLADLQFAYDFHRRLRQSGSHILSVAAHPGVVHTDLQRHIPTKILREAFSKFPQVSEPWQGALPSLFAATEPSVESGDFYGPDGASEFSGYPAKSKHDSDAIRDQNQWKKLWDFAESATSTHFEF